LQPLHISVRSTLFFEKREGFGAGIGIRIRTCDRTRIRNTENKYNLLFRAPLPMRQLRTDTRPFTSPPRRTNWRQLGTVFLHPLIEFSNLQDTVCSSRHVICNICLAFYCLKSTYIWYVTFWPGATSILEFS
jgi:hypothetical protein